MGDKMSAINNPTLLNSKDIFSDILIPNRDRKMSSQGNEINIYFYRYIGVNSEREYFDKIINLNRELSKLDKQYILFKNKIDIPMNNDVTNKINSNSNNIKIEDFASGEIVDKLVQMGIMNITNNIGVNEKFVFAYKEVTKLYAINEKLTNLSIGINFAIKLLCWSIEYVPNRYSSFMSIYNPKVVYYGDIKKHEAYLLILFSLIGWDVLFLNSWGDEILKNIDKNNKYSFFHEETNKIKVKEIELLVTKSYSSVAENNFYSSEVKEKVVLVSSEHICEDILVPLSKRNNYVENALYPVYFSCYIGIGEESEIYYNSIYNLDKKLSVLKNGYLKLENQIPMINNIESSEILNEILTVNNFFDLNHKDILIKRILNLKKMPKFQEENRNDNFKIALKEVINLYMEREKNINASKIQNFVIKLLGWTNRYLKQLFREDLKLKNPKILYYGDIKAHEVYFLILFFKLGCDIVYLNSDQDTVKIIKDIDVKSEYTFIKDYNKYSKLEAFPMVEKQVRKNTVAYNASQEIQQVIYGDSDTGLFKPWQYEGGVTVPVGLKTTYDELKLLWREPANIRPEFKVENNRVYTPNLFVKLNGVFDNLDDYWTDYKFFTQTENTFVIKSIPFTNVVYSKQELYSAAFLLNGNGIVDREKIFKSPMYKFGYLKNSLQEFIVYKINELILANPFKGAFDEKLKLKIIMTILTLDGEALKLLEKFDFTSKVPKIVVYSNSREALSQEDSIFLAFFNIVGADILVLTPTNYNNLELTLAENMFDLHQLPGVAFDLQIPNVIVSSGQSVKSSIFKFLNFKGGNNK